MVHIQDLPVELLQHILSSLVDLQYEAPLNPADSAGHNDDDDDDDDLDEDIRNVCLVSQLFRQLAQPLLFQHFDDDGLSGDIRKTVSFTTAIYRRPELGKHVQSVNITPIELGPDDALLSQDLDAEDFALLKSAIQDLQLGSQEKRWISDMEHSDVSVFAALLLNKTPDVRHLTLTGDQFFPNQIPHIFKQNPSFLSNLESLEVVRFDEYIICNIASYEQFLTLPKLESVRFDGGILSDASFPSTWTPGTLAMGEVEFSSCHIDTGAIQKLIQACKNIKSFKYDSFDADSPTLRPPIVKHSPEFNAAQAYNAALHHKDTLGHFEIALARYEPILNVEEYISRCDKIGSFREFSVLENICMPHASLPPHPQFPPTMHLLHITDCNASVRDMVQNIATDCKNGLYPNFETLRVFAEDVTKPIRLSGNRIPPGQTPQDCFLSLKEMFNGTKVDFQILPYKKPPNFGEEEEDDDDEDYDEDYDYDDDELERGPMGPMASQFMDILFQEAVSSGAFVYRNAPFDSDD